MAKFVYLSVIEDKSICYEDCQKKPRLDQYFNAEKISRISEIKTLKGKDKIDFTTYEVYSITVDGIQYFIDNALSPRDQLVSVLES